MKIMFTTGCMKKGGAERVIATLSNNMIKNNDVAILVTQGAKSEYFLDEKINYMYLCEENCKLNNLTKLRKLKKYIIEYKPDVIVSFLPEPSFRNCFLKLFNPTISKIPLIISVRNDPKIEYNNFFRRIIMRLFYPIANGFVFQTKDAQKYFNKKIQEKSTIIFNPISSNFNEKLFSGTRDKIIVSVGRLEPQKNFTMLINSFNIICKIYDDYKLYIYGDGSQKVFLQEQINSLKLNNKIFLLGEVNNIADKIYNKSMFVMSSVYEGMPNALIEAMTLGLPCISTDCPCGGARELINDGINGMLVPVDDVEGLAICMQKIINDDDFSKSISNEARKIYEQLNENIICNKWNDYILKRR